MRWTAKCRAVSKAWRWKRRAAESPAAVIEPVLRGRPRAAFALRLSGRR
ncbi:hypothetical protein [Lysobacter gummosus]